MGCEMEQEKVKSTIEMTDAKIYFDSLGHKGLMGNIKEHSRLNIEDVMYVKTSRIIKEHSDKLFETLNTIYNVISWAK